MCVQEEFNGAPHATIPRHGLFFSQTCGLFSVNLGFVFKQTCMDNPWHWNGIEFCCLHAKYTGLLTKANPNSQATPYMEENPEFRLTHLHMFFHMHNIVLVSSHPPLLLHYGEDVTIAIGFFFACALQPLRLFLASFFSTKLYPRFALSDTKYMYMCILALRSLHVAEPSLHANACAK